MKNLACADIGISDGFVAKGATEEEVMGKMMEHVKEAHADMIEGKSEDEIMKMKEMMKEKMKDEI